MDEAMRILEAGSEADGEPHPEEVDSKAAAAAAILRRWWRRRRHTRETT
jgi:hypothetical protein